MPTASPVKLPGGDARFCYERERARAEARQLSDRALRETAQRAREALAGGISDRLPDGGKRLRLRMEASLGELSNRGLGKLVCEIYGSTDPPAIAECVQCKATLPHSASLEAASAMQCADPVSVMATNYLAGGNMWQQFGGGRSRDTTIVSGCARRQWQGAAPPEGRQG